ncbi:hypothetical protein [Streptomyces fagopyri]|uniref:hypothetical protein n=1 Tax=Streptomyces fagopyri TaxID=2662397 RepID=UPI0033F8088B
MPAVPDTLLDRDRDRVGVRPYAEEVVRTPQVRFGVDGVFDLVRVSAFVGGYGSVMPLTDPALLDGVRRLAGKPGCSWANPRCG